MENKLTKGEKEKMTLIEELSKLAITPTEKTKIDVAEQIRRIVENKGEINYQIIMLLIKEKIERGYTKDYTLRELQEKLPWKKSTTIERLHDVVNEGVLIHEKRRYKLNKKNELVRRIWNYYHETNHQEKEKMRTVWQLTQRKAELEKRIANLGMDEGKYKKLTKKEDVEFQKEMCEQLIDVYDPKALVQEFLLKNKVKVMGCKKER